MRTIYSIAALIVLSFYMTSCSHISSGQYIQLKKGETFDTLAKSYKVPLWKIQHHNEGKAQRAGTWVFLPLDRGVVAKVEQKRSVASVNYKENTLYQMSQGQFIWPVPASKRISSHFGHRWGRKHEGMDIPAHRGAHIVAADSGVVVYSGNELGGYGNIIVISHKNGFFTVYAHNNKNMVRKDQHVSKGEVIGTVGSTGRSTGNHLHFEIRQNSRALNPKKVLAGVIQ